jgi:hypothetical protein
VSSKIKEMLLDRRRFERKYDQGANRWLKKKIEKEMVGYFYFFFVRKLFALLRRLRSPKFRKPKLYRNLKPDTEHPNLIS